MSLALVPLKHNILLDVKVAEIKSSIITRINDLRLTDIKYKLDAEFLTLVCNLVEFLVHKKDGISKKDLVLEIFRDIFGDGFSDADLSTVSKNIDFIHANKTIKKVSWYKLFKTGLMEWFRKKG